MSMRRAVARLRAVGAGAIVVVVSGAGLAVGTSVAAADVRAKTYSCAGGASQEYVVPAGVSSVLVRAEGGASGGTVTATVRVSPGQVLGVVVGCADGGGYHWGAPGGLSLDARCADGDAGGGSSAVLTESFDERIVEAGGGGGAGGSCADSTGGLGGGGSQAGDAGLPGPGPQAAKGGNGGVRIAGHGDNGRNGRGATGAGGGGGGAGCRGGAGGFGGVDKAGGGGGGGSSCVGPLASRPVYGTGGTGKVVISPDHLSVTNSGSDVLDANGNGRQDIGDQIDYSVTVRNDGAVPVNRVTAAGTLGGAALALACDRAVLAPGEAVSCSTRHTVTAADVTRRSLPFLVTASGTSDSGEPLSAAATRTIALRPVPGMVVDFAAPVSDVNGNGRTDAGDVIEYAATVTNTGSGAIDRLAATSLVCGRTTLATGDSTRCAASHVISQGEVDDAGVVAADLAITGLSVESGQSLVGGSFASATPLDQIATLDVTNTVDAVRDDNGNGRPDAGDVIDYVVGVTNTGTVTLAGVSISLPGVTLDCDTADLAPAATLTCAGSYPIGQGDADLGSVTHVAAVLGRFHDQEVRSADVPAVTEVPMVAGMTADAEITTVRDTTSNGATDAGDVIEYRVTVGNGGTVTMTGLTVQLGPVAVACDTTTLTPGKSAVCTGSYAITQADVDGTEAFEVSALATARTPAGVASATAGPLRTVLSRVSALAVNTSTAPVDTNGNGLTDAGDVLGYTVTATNLGTVTLSEVDTALSDVALDCAPGTVAPGQSVTCHGRHQVSQADVDRGSVRHEATATGRNPWGETVTASPSQANTTFDQKATLTIAATTAMTDSNANGRTDVGDVITYTVTATNTGIVTLSEVDTTMTPDCAPADAAPAAGVTCTVTHEITSADWTAGAVIATFTADGTTPAGEKVTSKPFSVRTVLVQRAHTSDLAKTGVTAVEEMLIAGGVLLLAGLGLLVFLGRRRKRD